MAWIVVHGADFESLRVSTHVGALICRVAAVPAKRGGMNSTPALLKVAATNIVPTVSVDAVDGKRAQM